MDPQVGHADIVGVGVDEGNGQPASPVLKDGAFFAGKAPPGFSDFMMTHGLLLTPHPLSLSVYWMQLLTQRNDG